MFLQQGGEDYLSHTQKSENKKDGLELKTPEHQEVNEKEQLIDANVVAVKVNVVTNSRSLFAKEDYQLIHRYHPIFVSLKWFLRVSFLILIPISLMGYLLGSKNALENLNHSLEVGVFILRMYDAHLKAETSVVALSYLNGANYDGLLPQEITTQIITNAQQTLNESIARINNQITTEYFTEFMYKYYINWEYSKTNAFSNEISLALSFEMSSRS